MGRAEGESEGVCGTPSSASSGLSALRTNPFGSEPKLADGVAEWSHISRKGTKAKVSLSDMAKHRETTAA